MNWDNVIIGDFTMRQVATAAGVLFAVWLIAKVIAYLGKKPPAETHIETAKCHGCGWEGKVSSYRGRCPSCNNEMGQQSARS